MAKGGMLEPLPDGVTIPAARLSVGGTARLPLV